MGARGVCVVDGCFSTVNAATPERANANASVSPAGPAPTIKTGISMSAPFALRSTMTRLRGVNYRVEFGPPPLPGWVLRTQQVMWSDSHPLKHHKLRSVNNLARFKSSIGRLTAHAV